MADKFVINGGKKLSGEIEVRGSKNAAGPALIACLLTQDECVVDNIPFIKDILSILDVLKSMGVKVEKTGEEQVKIKAEIAQQIARRRGRRDRNRLLLRCDCHTE